VEAVGRNSVSAEGKCESSESGLYARFPSSSTSFDNSVILNREERKSGSQPRGGAMFLRFAHFFFEEGGAVMDINKLP